MNKETKNPRKYNHEVVNGLSEKYGVTKAYVRQCLRGDRNGMMADTLKKEYLNKKKEILTILNK